MTGEIEDETFCVAQGRESAYTMKEDRQGSVRNPPADLAGGVQPFLSVRQSDAIVNKLARVFAANLKRLRSEREWSIRHAASALGVAASTWSQWESGKRFPPVHILVLLPQLFELSICEIMGDCATCHRRARAGAANVTLPLMPLEVAPDHDENRTDEPCRSESEQSLGVHKT